MFLKLEEKLSLLHIFYINGVEAATRSTLTRTFKKSVIEQDNDKKAALSSFISFNP